MKNQVRVKYEETDSYPYEELEKYDNDIFEKDKITKARHERIALEFPKELRERIKKLLWKEFFIGESVGTEEGIRFCNEED